MLPLDRLRAGESARVAQLVGAADQVQRLEELGLRQGQPLKMVQPGTPCIIELGGSRLCFRGGETLGVLVTLVGD